jgi:hypothetical protein
MIHMAATALEFENLRMEKGFKTPSLRRRSMRASYAPFFSCQIINITYIMLSNRD